MQRRRSGNRRNDWNIFMSLYNLLAEIGLILQDIIQLCVVKKQKVFL